MRIVVSWGIMVVVVSHRTKFAWSSGWRKWNLKLNILFNDILRDNKSSLTRSHRRLPSSNRSFNANLKKKCAPDSKIISLKSLFSNQFSNFSWCRDFVVVCRIDARIPSFLTEVLVVIDSMERIRWRGVILPIVGEEVEWSIVKLGMKLNYFYSLWQNHFRTFACFLVSHFILFVDFYTHQKTRINHTKKNELNWISPVRGFVFRENV